MNDKTAMENILNLEKGVCGLYLHGSLEAAAPDVHTAFGTALKDSLAMQSEIYGKMSDKGWYAPAQVEKQKITDVKKKFKPSK
ncbi:MAG: spore coat protein [Oscillospiraceae bacterium]